MLISLRNLQGSIAFSLGVSTMVLIHAAHYAIFEQLLIYDLSSSDLLIKSHSLLSVVSVINS